MRITINVDCTDTEARRFLGLPDLTPLHQAMVEEMTEHLKGSMRGIDPETLVRQWMPMSVAGMDQLQKAFWSAMAGGAMGKRDDSAKRDDEDSKK